MRFQVGDKVQTNPDIKVQPNNWNYEGEMWQPHLDRCVMTVLSSFRNDYTCRIDLTGKEWTYRLEELIPYKEEPRMFQEAVEL